MRPASSVAPEGHPGAEPGAPLLIVHVHLTIRPECPIGSARSDQRGVRCAGRVAPPFGGKERRRLGDHFDAAPARLGPAGSWLPSRAMLRIGGQGKVSRH